MPRRALPCRLPGVAVAIADDERRCTTKVREASVMIFDMGMVVALHAVSLKGFFITRAGPHCFFCAQARVVCGHDGDRLAQRS